MVLLWFSVKLMLRIFECGVLVFDCFVYRQNLTCMICFTRCGHYAGEVEDIIIGRLTVVYKSLCKKLERLVAVL